MSFFILGIKDISFVFINWKSCFWKLRIDLKFLKITKLSTKIFRNYKFAPYFFSNVETQPLVSSKTLIDLQICNSPSFDTCPLIYHCSLFSFLFFIKCEIKSTVQNVVSTAFPLCWKIKCDTKQRHGLDPVLHTAFIRAWMRWRLMS